MLLALLLPAMAADLPTLPQATCDGLAAAFAEATIAPGGNPRLKIKLPPEELRASLTKLEGEFKATCPHVRGLDAGCVGAMGAILDTAQRVGAGNAAGLVGKLAPEIAHCMDAGGVDLLIRALDRPARMCDPRKPEPRWAGTCPVQTVAEQIRERLRASVQRLKGAEVMYDAEHDGFLPVGSEADARAAIAAWAPGESAEPVHAGFWVVVTEAADGGVDFEAHGILDSDKDGCVLHVVATMNTAPTVVPGTEACR
jgi:hypothetical protein